MKINAQVVTVLQEMENMKKQGYDILKIMYLPRRTNFWINKYKFKSYSDLKAY